MSCDSSRSSSTRQDASNGSASSPSSARPGSGRAALRPTGRGPSPLGALLQVCRSRLIGHRLRDGRSVRPARWSPRHRAAGPRAGRRSFRRRRGPRPVGAACRDRRPGRSRPQRPWGSLGRRLPAIATPAAGSTSPSRSSIWPPSLGPLSRRSVRPSPRVARSLNRSALDRLSNGSMPSPGTPGVSPPGPVRHRRARQPTSEPT